MAEQNFDTHVHRPTATAFGFFCWVAGVVGFILQWTHRDGSWAGFLAGAGMAGAVLALLAISRSYITRLQDRIIKLEMRVRAASVLDAERQRALGTLDNKRIAALRFASDEELPALIDRTIRDSLSPTDIKRAVRNWRPDLDRT